MRTKSVVAGLLAVVVAVAGMLFLPSVDTLAQTNTPTPAAAPPQGVPQIPMVVKGKAIGAPDGFKVVARIVRGAAAYESLPGVVKDGSYFVKVAPPDSRFIGEEIIFLLEGAEANERIRHSPGFNQFNFDLTFAEIPMATLTPTPVPVLPATYSGTIVVAGQAVTSDMVLVIRLGDYQSPPAAILDDGEFVNLVILTEDENLIGAPVEFFLNGQPSSPPAIGVFKPGSRQVVDLVFGDVPPTATPVPTETPIPTNTPIPPTATPEPTHTPIPPTATITPVPTHTPLPPTATAEPTATPVPPTATAEPTATPVPPTATPVPPVVETPEEEESGGGPCSTTSRLPFGEAAVNMLLLLAPLAMLGGVRYARGRNRRE